jgi:ferredoxin
MSRVVVDLDLCQGHGMCVVEAPSVFELAKGARQVAILTEQVDDEHLAAVKQAVKYCPNAALSLED